MAPLSPDQVSAYLDRVKLPEQARVWLREGPNGTHALEALTQLHHYHLANIQFEVLDLVYSEHRSLPLENDFVIDTLVQRKRGGTCAQVHQVFIQLLRSLGFTAYCTAGRINATASLLGSPGQDVTKVLYGTWVHVHTLVVVGDRTYVVDTNNGPWGVTSPIPLVHDEPQSDIGPRQCRMIHDSIPGQSSAKQKWWRIQSRKSEGEAWMDVYCFIDVEWFTSDFQLLQAGYTMFGAGWSAKPICFRVQLEESTPVGWVMSVGDELRKHYKGETETLQKFYSEEERVAALDEFFGVALTQDEQQSIVGLGAEIKDEDDDFYG